MKRIWGASLSLMLQTFPFPSILKVLPGETSSGARSSQGRVTMVTFPPIRTPLCLLESATL